MRNNHGDSRSALWARGLAAIWAVLTATCGAELALAAPFAYVANSGSNTVSVVDTATNTVAATVPVGGSPNAVVVTPDGKRAYVTTSNPDDSSDSGISVIDTATNKVAATISLQGVIPNGIAMTPDGKSAYVVSDRIADEFAGVVVTIDTAANKVVARSIYDDSVLPFGVAVAPDGKRVYVAADQAREMPGVVFVFGGSVGGGIPVGGNPRGIAVTPDGAYAYVTQDAGPLSGRDMYVSVIDTAANAIAATIPVGKSSAIAITPDGRYAYAADGSVIATATNTVVSKIPVGGASGIAISPNGKQAYIANFGDNSVSVVDTATNNVVATLPVGVGPAGVGIAPPPPLTPFGAFAAKLDIELGHKPNHDAFRLKSGFTLGQGSNGIDPAAEAVTLRIGAFATTIPAGSFKGKEYGPFKFHGEIDGVTLHVEIEPTGAKRYALEAIARRASLTGTKTPAPVTLTIGNDSGAASVKAHIDRDVARRDDD